MKNITIGFCSKTYNEQFISYLKNIFGEENQIICKVGSSSRPICECYNEIIEESNNDIIVLCHDDIEFLKSGLEQDTYKNLILQLFDQYPDYGIIGAIGGAINIEALNSAEMRRWYEGHLIQGYKQSTSTDQYLKLNNRDTFKTQLYDVATVDGLFMIINKNLISNKFDETNKSFHFYDIDFCFSNFENNIKIGVENAFLIKHNSEGIIDLEHELVRYNYFTPKWKHLLYNTKYSKILEINYTLEVQNVRYLS